MQSQIANFSFDDNLVRVVTRDGEPWFVGRDVCRALALKNESDALQSLDDDEKGVASTDPLSPGGSQNAVIVSEPGVYRLVFRSRKPEAERFKRWLAHDVLPQLRKTGVYAAEAAEYARDPGRDAGSGPEDPRQWPVHLRLQTVQLAARLHGAAVAKVMWPKLGLPALPPPPPTPLDEARVCLRHLLDSPVHEGGPRIREVLDNALEDDEEARLMLRAVGLRPEPRDEKFIVANRHPGQVLIWRGTPWAGGLVAPRVLRRLPGAEVAGKARYGHLVSGGTALPAHLLDEMGDAKALMRA